MGNKIKTEVIKIQASQYPYHVGFLVYNEDRSIEFQSAFDQKFFDEAMEGEEKAYFETNPAIAPDDENGFPQLGLSLGKKLEDQGW